MGKIWTEVCLISARGLRQTSSLWKLQWYDVGWIDPNNKYCSKIDSSRSANPVWKTKFSMLVDTSELDALHIEVYSREPIFLREKLLGTATVILKEFLDKYNNNSEISKPVEKVGSFQLRRNNSNKPQGFVDVSIRISEEREEPSSLPDLLGDNEGFKLADNNSGFNLANGYKPAPEYPQQQALTPAQLQGNQPQPNHQYARQVPCATNYSHPSVGGTSMPQSGTAAARNARPGFGMGVGAGALPAGAVIFGEDFMYGFDIPRGLPDPSLTISLEPPF
ncbi:PREDICTED: uncharacterized protein LOC109220517 [Nicotiana attenuata]|uniref:uncharacterized protein LOC109220517 n=1 Tax=Nicotiana attenuata TaxID=49451 RepID=UPI00090556F9|nr:PREDICTED: uncharacterized protein LOC109220517 [Nicotiana attenuata]